MGRSPFFADYVKPTSSMRVISSLEEYFNSCMSAISFKEIDNISVGVKTPTNKAVLLIGASVYNPPLLERSCSVYRGYEDSFPNPDTEYLIIGVRTYTFCNQHSSNIPFSYHVLEVAHPDPKMFSTFCIRTDGLVLNQESFTPRGWITDASITFKKL